MPIGDYFRTAYRLAPLLLLGALIALPAMAAVRVENAEALSREKPVMKIEKTYRLLSSANVVYALCAQPLAITQVQQKYLSMLFETTGNAYLKAYIDAYTARVMAPPSKEMMNSFVTIMTKAQQEEVNRMTLYIHQKNCQNQSVKEIAAYIENLRINQLQTEAQQSQKERDAAARAIEEVNAKEAKQAPTDEAQTAAAPDAAANGTTK